MRSILADQSVSSRARVRVLVAALTLVVTSGLAPAGLHAQSPATTMEVRTAATFLRDAPNLSGRVLTRLAQGTRVEVLERPEGDWWRVRAGDPPREGYVHRLVLAPVSTPARPRTPASPRSTTPRTPDAGEAVDAPEPDDATTRVRRPSGPGGLAFAGAGVFMPTARETFDAVDITGNPVAFRGGVEVTRLYRGLFVGVMVERVSETGERAFLTADGERFGLGIPLDVTLTPVDITAGWRFEAPASSRLRRVVPFVGGGAGVLRYRETDEFAEGDESVDEQFASYHVVGGADVALARWVGLRLEYRFRFVPDSLGEAGVSAITGDTSLGGSTFGVAVVIGR